MVNNVELDLLDMVHHRATRLVPGIAKLLYEDELQVELNIFRDVEVPVAR